MKVNLKENKKKKIVTMEIEGEVDVYTSMDLKKSIFDLIENGNSKIIVNLDKVTYMDSSGLGTLVAALKKIKSEKGNLKILKLTPSIKKIFELTRLTKFFEIFEDEAEAEKSFE